MSKSDFSDVQDGLGSAQEVPPLIRKLASGRRKEREAAFVELSDERLVHQGTRWPAAVPAVRLLLEELGKAKHPGRELVLSTLAHIAVAHPPSFAATASAEAIKALRADAGLEGECYRLVAAAADDIEQHLTSAQAVTRAHAAALLALLAPQRAAALLVKQCKAEKDEETSAAMKLALAVALRLGGDGELGKAPRSGKLARAAHSIATALAGGSIKAAELEPALKPPLGETMTPYGPVDRLALSAALTLGQGGAKLLASALQAASGSQKGFFAQALVKATFPGSAHAEAAPLVSIDSLSQSQLAVLELLAQAAPENSWGPLNPLNSVGISGWLPCLRRFLGLDPRGPLEARIAWRGSQVEAFVVMDTLARGEASEEEARSALLVSLDPRARTDLAMLVNEHVYGLVLRDEWTDERADQFACSLFDDPRCWPRLREHIKDFEHNRSWGAWLMLAGWLRHGKGEGDVGLAPIFHSVVARSRGHYADRVRQALAAAPAPLRDELTLSFPLPELIDRSPRIGGQPVPPALAGWALLDLAADRTAAARRGAQAIAQWRPVPATARRDVHPVEVAVQALTALLPDSRISIREALKDATREGKAILKRIEL